MFSILIPTWKNLEDLRQCVRSIRENSPHAHQIIVHVDDGSDGSRGWLMSAQLDAAFCETNVGICRAVNEAAQLADHDLIIDETTTCSEQEKTPKSLIYLGVPGLYGTFWDVFKSSSGGAGGN